MRIVIYSYNYHPEPIGIAPLMTELAEGLVRRGHQVRVITGMPNYPQRQIYSDYRGKFYLVEPRQGVRVQRSYVWVRSDPGLLDRILLDGSFVVSSLPQAFNGWRPDLVFATVPPLPVCLPATLLRWIYRCPLVLNVQDILPDGAIQVGLLKNSFLIGVFRILEKFAYRHASKISVIADGFTDNLLNKQVPPQKLVQIPNWVDVNFIRPLSQAESAFRRENQLQGKFVVLYSGNIALTQGLETVVAAAAQLQDLPDVRFVIVGEAKALETLKQEYQPGTNVLLRPFQPREMLPDMLAAADVGLVVQKRNISFNMPSKIPVILASGRAIVGSVSANGSAAQAIRRSGGGLVVEPENPAALAGGIRELYANREKTAYLGRQGREYAVAQYSFDRALREYEGLFSQLIPG
ncbi:glycosyltransferase family 4 protein [Geitlerinema sp. PCC 9228]|uniref:glycosyltransferase family 4 protein n=1 Tax=Geitlerinema sp. PCC 9228 TaxID=111611 RepID=UPI0008F9B8F6|nr:glycosyltransferase family 4 protein [Geitlerinema sp. PCC 9228]